MDQFVRSQNVERYRRLLERVTDEPDREQIINLLAEERKKQKKRRWRSGLIASMAANFAKLPNRQDARSTTTTLSG
jgi:hypothetical protein